VITRENPKPIKLKFEKVPTYLDLSFLKPLNFSTFRGTGNGNCPAQVYLPCILQTKKRYVGYMYESRDQLKPEYDAKGIETVRLVTGFTYLPSYISNYYRF
jgi:hypothetical protein